MPPLNRTWILYLPQSSPLHIFYICPTLQNLYDSTGTMGAKVSLTIYPKDMCNPLSNAHLLGLLTQPGHRGAGWLCSWSAEIAPLFLRFCFAPFYWQKVLVQYSQQRDWVPAGNCSFHSSLSKGVRIGSPAWHYRFAEVRLAAALTSLREMVSFLNGLP